MAWMKFINPSNPIFGTPPNTVEIQPDGNLVLNGTAKSWDDLRFPLSGQRLDISAGRVDYNYDDCTVDFQDNALYPDDVICFVAQMSHSKKLGDGIELHLHWLQNQNQIPNWLIAYRWINTSEGFPVVGNEILIPWSSNIVTYAAGNISQLTEFGSITKPVEDTLSSALAIRLFRDTNNDSNEFSGADLYSGDAQALEFDIHYIKDGFGSNQEYVK